MCNNPDYMEMPCMCNCGEWFDLNEGYASEFKSNVVMCEKCHQKEEEKADLECKIEDLENEVSDLKFDIEQYTINLDEWKTSLPIKEKELQELKDKFKEYE